MPKPGTIKRPLFSDTVIWRRAQTMRHRRCCSDPYQLLNKICFKQLATGISGLITMMIIVSSQ